MEENWYALFISIVKNLSVEDSFKAMYYNVKENKNKSPTSRKRSEKFMTEDVEKMIELKKTMSYKEVGLLFNTTDENIYKHIKKYKPELINSGIFKSKKAHTKLGFL